MGELVEQGLDSPVDVVDYGPDRFDGLSGGVGKVPVEAALARKDPAAVAAAHSYDDVGREAVGVVVAGLGRPGSVRCCGCRGEGRRGRTMGFTPQRTDCMIFAANEESRENLEQAGNVGLALSVPDDPTRLEL